MGVDMGNTKSQMRVALMAAWVACAGAPMVASASSLAGVGTWQTDLEARYLGGSTTPNAYYDKALNITWLADANYFATQYAAATDKHAFLEPLLADINIPVTPWTPWAKEYAFIGTWGVRSGAITPTAARNWVSSLDIGGVSGWRLPKMFVDQNSSIGSPDWLPSPASSELAHMDLLTLGNTPSHTFDESLFNTGPFSNLTGEMYQTGTVSVGSSYVGATWYFYFKNGMQFADGSSAFTMAWAVHDGDVGAVPEPHAGALLLVGALTLLGARVRARS
jgi:hypothetical protein